jgi:glycosyltransferase involved in cell wall biosynthesis
MKTKTMPMVSVIVPSYNHAHFLSEAIDSVLAQTYPHHEIIVVDDGSTDRTPEVVSQYSGVRFIRQRNRGPAAARNRGIQESRGEYVVFLDADDRLLPQHFEVSLDALRSHPEVGWVCGDFRFIGTGDQPWRHVHYCEPTPDHFGSLLRLSFVFVPNCVMYHQHVLVKIGGFDESESVRYCEDTELYLRLIRHVPLFCHHQVIAEYRLTDEQASRRWHVMLRSSIHVLRAQWPFVRGHRLYGEAYYVAIARVRAHYGERALWQMVADARSGQWARALQAFRVLLTCYPAGLVNLLVGKARRMLSVQNKSS